MDAVALKIVAEIKPDVGSLGREQVQTSAMVYALSQAKAEAEQANWKLWQQLKKEKADLISQGEEVPKFLLRSIAEIEAEVELRLSEKEAAREAAAST
jgi:uncharacterized membrane protein